MADVLSPPRTRVLLALIRVYQRDGRATVRAVAVEGERSIVATHKSLGALRDAGFVDWTPGQEGTLRPLIQPVQVLDHG